MVRNCSTIYCLVLIRRLRDEEEEIGYFDEDDLEDTEDDLEPEEDDLIFLKKMMKNLKKKLKNLLKSYECLSCKQHL